MKESIQDRKDRTDSRVDDEFSLKDIILKIQYWWSIVWPHRFRITFLSIIFGISMALCVKFLMKPEYTASYQLFFQEESNGLSSAMRLASSFGLGSGGRSVSSSAVVKEFITSRTNIAFAMTKELEKSRLIDLYYEEEFKKNEFFAKEFVSKFGFNQRYTDSTLTQLYYILNEDHFSVELDKEGRMLTFQVSAKNEELAFDLAYVLVKNTEEQFKNWKREKSIGAIKGFQKKVDSLKMSIDLALLQLGQYEDQNNSLVSSVDKMKRMRLTIDLESLKVAYGEYIKGLEMSKSDLINLDAPFKYFDEPTYPQKKKKISTVTGGCFGVLIASFVLSFFFIGRAEALNIMADN